MQAAHAAVCFRSTDTQRHCHCRSVPKPADFPSQKEAAHQPNTRTRPGSLAGLARALPQRAGEIHFDHDDKKSKRRGQAALALDVGDVETPIPKKKCDASDRSLSEPRPRPKLARPSKSWGRDHKECVHKRRLTPERCRYTGTSSLTRRVCSAIELHNRLRDRRATSIFNIPRP